MLTREQIESLSSRELDVKVERTFFPQELRRFPVVIREIPRFSSDYNAAFMLVREMRRRGYDAEISTLPNGNWYVVLHIDCKDGVSAVAEDKSLCVAIGQASLLAVMGEEKA